MSQVLRRMLVAVDGSAPSQAAITLALRLARRHESELLFCHAVDHTAALTQYASVCAYDAQGLLKELDERAEALLAGAVRRAGELGIPASTTILEGRAAEAIAAFARQHATDAIVMGTRGNGGVTALLLGSTANGVLRMADPPVFVVHSGHAESNAAEASEPTMSPPLAGPPFRRILVAIDDSEPAHAAAAFATELAAADGSALVFCHVIPMDNLLTEAADSGYDTRLVLNERFHNAESLVQSAAKHAEARGVKVHRAIGEGHPVDELLAVARVQRADLIAVGTHGRRRLRRLWFGSVATGVVRRSPIPVVAVRTATAHAAESSAASSTTPRKRDAAAPA
jgi:nucleotide-binding universal stress UspA family protein